MRRATPLRQAKMYKGKKCPDPVKGERCPLCGREYVCMADRIENRRARASISPYDLAGAKEYPGE